MNNQDLEHIQQVIGYRFRNLDLLQQAFVRRSYSEENGGEDNEVLEFIGDKVLDLIVVRLLTEAFGFMIHDSDDFDEAKDFDEFACEKNEAQLTELKRRLVQKKYLAQRIDDLGLADYLITGNGDHSRNEASVKEDLFEAIIGAAAIDSGWNMEELRIPVEVMLEPDSVISGEQDNDIARIQDWTAKKGIGTPLYHFEEGNYTSTWYIMSDTLDQKLDMVKDRELISQIKFRCLLNIRDDLPVFRGFGRSKREARRNACATACRYLEEKGLLFSIRDEIPDPNRNDAISQLEILSRRGYFPLPKYRFGESHDENGNPVWQCVCSIPTYEYAADAVSSSKKDAKKTAAFAMLKHVLEKE